MGTIIAAVPFIVLIGKAFYSFYKGIKKVKDAISDLEKVKSVFSSIKSSASTAFDFIKNKGRATVDALKSSFSTLKDYGKTAFDGIIRVFL